MGLVLILAASNSRRPMAVRASGDVMCLQAVAANVFGIERARAITEWEAMRGTALLCAGSVVALTSGIVIAIAFRETPSNARRKTARQRRPNAAFSADLRLLKMQDAGKLRALASWKVHTLTGDRKGTWSLSVTRNRRLTFTIDGDREICDLHLDDYH